MTFRVEFSETAKKELKKIDKYHQKLIIEWIEKNLVGCSNPRQHGKPLVANRKGQWRYRVEDYRILAEIIDDRVVILVLNVGHRREVYE